MCCIGASLSQICNSTLHRISTPLRNRYRQIPQYIYTEMVKNPVRPFSGEVDPSGNVEDPEAWLDHFDMVSVSNGWNTDVLKKQHFPIYLTGEAEAWYKVNRAWINLPATTWAQVSALITTRFRPGDFMDEL